MLALIFAAGLASGLVRRGWLILPAAALLPAVLPLTGALDDGEGAATLVWASALFAAAAGGGLALSRGLKRLGPRPAA